jgi:hypothetical protein
MENTPHLYVSMPHVEKLADLFVLLPPIFPLTSLGTIQGGLACCAVLELEIWRCFGSAGNADHGHDCCWSGARVVSKCNAVSWMQTDLVERSVSYRINLRLVLWVLLPNSEDRLYYRTYRVCDKEWCFYKLYWLLHLTAIIPPCYVYYCVDEFRFLLFGR